MDIKFEPAATVSITELRRRLGFYLDLVLETCPVVITKYDQPFASLIALKTIIELTEQTKTEKGEEEL